MPELRIIKNGDSVLHVTLHKEEDIFAQSGTILVRDAHLKLTGDHGGDVITELRRMVLAGESLYLQHIEAREKAGNVLLAQPNFSDIELLTVDKTSYYVAFGAYLASTAHVELIPVDGNAPRGILNRVAGWGFLKTEGAGQVAVSQAGSIFSMNVAPNMPVIVDVENVVAFEEGLEWNALLSGMISSVRKVKGRLGHSLWSGEALAICFEGTGKVYVCSSKRIKSNGGAASDRGTF